MCNNHIILLYLPVCFNQNSSPVEGFNTTATAFASNQTWPWRQALSWWSAHQSTCATRPHVLGGHVLLANSFVCHRMSSPECLGSWGFLKSSCLRQAINDDVAANQWQQVSTNEIFRNRLPVVNMVVVFLCFCGCAWGELFASPCIVVFSAGLWFLPFGRSHVSDVFIVVLSCHGAFRAPPSRPGSPRRWETPQKPVHISISKPV